MHIDINYDGTFRRSCRCEYFNFLDRSVNRLECVKLSHEHREKHERRMYRVGRPTVVLSFPLDKRAFLVSPPSSLLLSGRGVKKREHIMTNIHMTKKDCRREGDNLIIFSISI